MIIVSIITVAKENQEGAGIFDADQMITISSDKVEEVKKEIQKVLNQWWSKLDTLLE